MGPEGVEGPRRPLGARPGLTRRKTRCLQQPGVGGAERELDRVLREAVAVVEGGASAVVAVRLEPISRQAPDPA